MQDNKIVLFCIEHKEILFSFITFPSIFFVFDSATPSSKAKPAGAHGCEIWAKIGKETPKSESELHYLDTCTATPFLNTFDGEEAGETVHYWLRWVNTKGERGPWSTPVNAMVVA